MGWLIALAVVVALAFLPLGISASYGESGAAASLTVGPLSFLLYPGKKEGKKTPKKESAKGQGQASSQKGGAASDFVPLVRAILDFLVDFRRKIRVQLLVLHITLAGGDPCDLAVNYGKAQAALEGFYPQLDRFFIIKKRDIDLACDFMADKTEVFARLDITITLGRLLAVAARHGRRVIREFMRIVKLRKGGAMQ